MLLLHLDFFRPQDAVVVCTIDDFPAVACVPAAVNIPSTGVSTSAVGPALLLLKS
jgi:hypothetical protein